MKDTSNANPQQQPSDTANSAATLNELTETQSKYHKDFLGLVLPRGPALEHPAAPLLMEYATNGCDAAIHTQWSMEMLEAAISRSAHPSALEPEPAVQLQTETLEKVDQGYAQLVAWDSIKHNPPPMLKISPIAAIPHKSWGYHMILNLSYGVTTGTICHPSVNESTSPDVAPMHAMNELGRVLPRLIYAIATAPDNSGPILFSKLDVKDGYWRMVITPEDEWNFTYILPKLTPDEPTQLVIPSCLQMGWCQSASYFCTASETARDVSETLADQPTGSLPAHPLEEYLLPPTFTTQTLTDTHAQAFLHLLEVYIDDFIQLAQCTDPAQLLHLTRAILHGIHSIFPPPSVTGGTEEDPVALKKLCQGDGLWDT